MADQIEPTRRALMTAPAVLAAVAAPAGAQTGLPVAGLTYVFSASVKVAPSVDFAGGDGARRFIPITGGAVEGPRLKGVVLAGGADWQTIRADGRRTLSPATPSRLRMEP
jgi:hypothetical protein